MATERRGPSQALLRISLMQTASYPFFPKSFESSWVLVGQFFGGVTNVGEKASELFRLKTISFHSDGVEADALAMTPLLHGEVVKKESWVLDLIPGWFFSLALLFSSC